MTLSRQHTKWRGEKALCGPYDAIAFLLCQGHVLHENTVRARQSKDSTTLCRLVNKSQFAGMIQHLNVPPRMLNLLCHSAPIARQHTLPCINVDQPICRLPLSDPFRRWKHFGRCTSGSFWKSHPKFNVLVVIQPLPPPSHLSPLLAPLVSLDIVFLPFNATPLPYTERMPGAVLNLLIFLTIWFRKYIKYDQRLKRRLVSWLMIYW